MRRFTVELKLEVELENSAFHDEHDDYDDYDEDSQDDDYTDDDASFQPIAEIQRILRKLSDEQLTDYEGMNLSKTGLIVEPLFDINGNRVGSAELVCK